MRFEQRLRLHLRAEQSGRPGASPEDRVAPVGVCVAPMEAGVAPVEAGMAPVEADVPPVEAREVR